MNQVGSQTAIKATGLTAGKGPAPVFHDLSFELDAGSFTALVGPNGCGKTTLFETLLGLVRPRQGSVDVLATHPKRARRRIAYVPQASRLDHDGQFVGRDFVAAAYQGHRWGVSMHPRRARKAIDRALACVGATALAQYRLASLSGGQRQRLMIAQALVNAPGYVFMDEPLAQLDPAAVDDIVSLAAHLCRDHGIGVLFSTHDVNPVIEALDQVLYLAGGTGRVGRADEIMTDAVLSELYGVPMHVVRERGHVFVTRAPQRFAHGESRDGWFS